MNTFCLKQETSVKPLKERRGRRWRLIGLSWTAPVPVGLSSESSLPVSLIKKTPNNDLEGSLLTLEIAT